MKKRHLAVTIAAVLATGSITAQEAIDLDQISSVDGFVIYGHIEDERVGRSVSGAGDINGDGIDDVIVGAPAASPGNPERNFAGKSYVVFGNESGYPAGLNLSDLNDSNGFEIDGVDPSDYSGVSVSGAGDVNGDGIDDVIIGAPNLSGTVPGESYVVFGNGDGFPTRLDLASLIGISNEGFVINGIDSGDDSGQSVSKAGDVNGDGIDDVIIGADKADPGIPARDLAGEAYVVFGTNNGSTTDFDLSSINGSNGFFLIGDRSGDFSGRAVSGAGDVNGDGIDDVIVGAIGADPGDPVRNGAGKTYVIFGFDNSAVSTIFLGGLNGANGFVLNGINAGDYSGRSVSGAGDVNGDGFDDVIVGASTADNRRGQSYVVFGSGGGFPPSLDLTQLNGSNGFVLSGFDPNDYSGSSVSNVGDVNGDGIDDVIIGARGANQPSTGASYVVFGRTSGFPATLNVSDVNGTNGFALNGVDIGDRSGAAVSGAGDVNGDGISDLIIGAFRADLEAVYEGESYVLFGNAVPRALGSQSLLFEELEDDSDPLGSRLDFSVAAQYLDNDAFGGMAVVADASTSAPGAVGIL
ncbi:MAG: integrin alpha [Lysobacterales bacterium]